jgi:hypothetical protein
MPPAYFAHVPVFALSKSILAVLAPIAWILRRLDFPSGIRYSPCTKRAAALRYLDIRHLEATMLSLRRRCESGLIFAFLAGALLPAAASESGFPFGSALVLDTAPLPGSKRVPMIEIEENGAAALNLWCSSVRGSASVANDTISIVPATALPSQCTPDQISRDAGLLAQLAQVTGWRRQGDQIELLGVATLRFRLMTN